MKKLFFVFAGLLAAVLVGCRTSEVTYITPPEPTYTDDGMQVTAYLVGSNYGYYLFDCIPLFVGNPDRPNTKDYHVLFEDRLSELHNEEMLNKFARQVKLGKVRDVTHERRSSGVSTLWIVWTNSISSKGIAVKPAK